jgi:transposase-like protein
MEKQQTRKCPQCGGLVVNSGKTGAGSQRVLCTECGKRFTPKPKKKGYTQEIRDQAIKLHLAGSSGRQVGKVLGMSKANVYIWAKKNLDSVDK